MIVRAGVWRVLSLMARVEIRTRAERYLGCGMFFMGDL